MTTSKFEDQPQKGSLNKEFWNVKMHAKLNNIHISGNEKIVSENFINEAISGLVLRAKNHENGRPDFINIKIQKLKEIPVKIEALKVIEVDTKNPKKAREFLNEKLSSLTKNYEKILDIFYNLPKAKGAIILNITTLKRMNESEIRVSSFDSLHSYNEGIENPKIFQKNHFKEALALASKVACCSGYIAEICVSDDINYTTGYLAYNKKYLRIKNMKNQGETFGGRIFLFNEEANIEDIIQYLKYKPIFVEF